MRYLILALFLVGCSSTIEVKDSNGNVNKITVENKNILNKVKVVENEEVTIERGMRAVSCSHAGFCFGYKGWGFHAFCPGVKNQSYREFEFTYHYTYEIKGKGTLLSPTYKDKRDVVLLESSCD